MLHKNILNFMLSAISITNQNGGIKYSFQSDTNSFNRYRCNPNERNYSSEPRYPLNKRFRNIDRGHKNLQSPNNPSSSKALFASMNTLLQSHLLARSQECVQARSRAIVKSQPIVVSLDGSDTLHP